MCILESGDSEAEGLSARKLNTACSKKWKEKGKKTPNKPKQRISVSRTVAIFGVAGGKISGICC